MHPCLRLALAGALSLLALGAPASAQVSGSGARFQSSAQGDSQRPDPLAQGGALGSLMDLPGAGAGGGLGVLQIPSSVVAPVGRRLSFLEPRVFDVIVPGSVTGTGYNERFLLQLPDHLKAHDPAPLLMVFHGFGKTAESVTQVTDFPSYCQERGWFLLAPLGASTKHFGSLPSQINTRYVLDLVLARLGRFIDSERLYAVGFSMGGGAALNFAARHLDPAGPMFAAVLNHTGGVALRNTWQHDLPVRWILEFWFGGAPSATGFSYDQCSSIDFNSSTLEVRSATDMGRNLAHLAVRHHRAAQDPLAYVVQQNVLLHAHLLGLGVPSVEAVEPGALHAWSSLDQRAALDWLGEHRLSVPLAASTLADRDGTWFHFQVQQDAFGSFTPFTWESDPLANRLSISATANLDTLTADLIGLELTTSALVVELDTADGLADRVRLTPVPSAPHTVWRDGVPTDAWVWDAQTRVLTLEESDGGAHTWELP